MEVEMVMVMVMVIKEMERRWKRLGIKKQIRTSLKAYNGRFPI